MINRKIKLRNTMKDISKYVVKDIMWEDVKRNN